MYLTFIYLCFIQYIVRQKHQMIPSSHGWWKQKGRIPSSLQGFGANILKSMNAQRESIVFPFSSRLKVCWCCGSVFCYQSYNPHFANTFSYFGQVRADPRMTWPCREGCHQKAPLSVSLPSFCLLAFSFNSSPSSFLLWDCPKSF